MSPHHRREKQGIAEVITGELTVALSKLPDNRLREILDLDLTSRA